MGQPATSRALRSERIGAGVVALACLGVLVTAAWLAPSEAGHGTHEQLGLPACGWVAMFDRPCPTCGMTTSFAHAASGDFARSWAAHPLAAVLVVGTSVVFWGGLHAAVSAGRIGALALQAVNGKTLALLGVMGLAAWVYKIMTWTGG